MRILPSLLLFALLSQSCSPLRAESEAYFAVPDFAALPPNIEVISEKTEDGVKVTEFYFAGAPFNNAPTRIYAYYCRPEKEGVYPAVVELHGAGLGELGPGSGIEYAKNGFCCITIDWAGRCPDRKEPRKPPCSEFKSPGNLAYALPEAEKASAPPHGWKSYGPDVDGIHNGGQFVRRAVMFLKSRPEVNPKEICIAGMSAGAHLTLLVLGLEDSFKAAAVKYGRGFIRDQFFGGYFGPIVMCDKASQDAWLAALDPKHHMKDINASVLLLSGTDDIFFWMPGVLTTYRAIPTEKRLLMLPNDNHSQVGNVAIPLAWFRSVLKLAPPFPSVEVPTAFVEQDKLKVTAKVTSATPVSDVSFWIKRAPLGNFHWSGKEVGHVAGESEPAQPVRWESVPATLENGLWVASIPAAQPDEQIVLYAMVEDGGGNKVSSDTLEFPGYPAWRALKE